MLEGKNLFKADRASLFMLDQEKNELWSQVATGAKGQVNKSLIIKVPADAGLVGASVKTGELINVPDAHADERFCAKVDDTTHFLTKSVLVMPLKDDEGTIIGAIQMINKKTDGSITAFTSDDERLLRMMTSHVTSFISIVG